MTLKMRTLNCVSLTVVLLLLGVGLKMAYAVTIESSFCASTTSQCNEGMATPAPLSGCAMRPLSSCEGTTCYNCDGSWEQGNRACVTWYTPATCNPTGNPIACGDLWRRSCHIHETAELSLCVCGTSGGTKEGGCTFNECTIPE